MPGPAYGSVEYWDERYSEVDFDPFDWLFSYEHVSPLLDYLLLTSRGFTEENNDKLLRVDEDVENNLKVAHPLLEKEELQNAKFRTVLTKLNERKIEENNQKIENLSFALKAIVAGAGLAIFGLYLPLFF